MAETVKSIFRQREVEKLYTMNMVNTLSSSYKNEWTINVISNFQSEPLSDKIIGEYDVEITLLEAGEHFYYIEDKLVETENTRKSKEKCDAEFKDQTDYKDRFFGMQKSYKELKEEFNQYKEEHKYKNRFLNF